MVPFREHAVFIVPDDGSQIDVRVTSETVWLTAAEMSELFGREASGIRRHIRNVFAEREVPDDESYRKNLPVTSDTGGHPEPIYNLDVIISVGYRVKSQRGVAFRQWATRILKERLTGDLRRRAAESEQMLYGLKNIELLAHSAATTRAEETQEVLAPIEKYARSWHLLLQYDEKKLPSLPGEERPAVARRKRARCPGASRCRERSEAERRRRPTDHKPDAGSDHAEVVSRGTLRRGTSH